MSLEINKLPNNIEALKGIIFNLQNDFNEQKQEYETQFETQKQGYESQINYLEEQIKLWKDRLFGRRTEKISDEALGQIRLFNEIEEAAGKEQGEEKIIIAEHTRKKGGRKALPKDLPRIDIIHELPQEEQKHSCGRMMKEIGEEITEKLRLIPQQVIVEVHHRKKYACPCEGVDSEGIEGAVRIAPMPGQIIPQGIATPSLIAYILTGKFADALPFYRQEQIFERMGIELPRQTMCRWAVEVYEQCRPILDMMKKDTLKENFMGIDETPVQVLSEGEKKSTTKSYMWVSRGGTRDKPILLYQYFPNRSSNFVKEYLKDYGGYLQCDAYSAYETAGLQYILVGCWAHARRKFMDVLKASPKNTNSAQMAINYIRKLYAIEDESWDNNLSAEEIKQIRQEKSKPILEEFKRWLDKRVVEVPSKSTLGLAINYVINEWSKLIVYIEDGRIPIDNNLVENAIRPFVLGRKNWLFSGSPNGAHASAGMYSLIETAKANGLEPFWYLLHLFEELPHVKTTEDYIQLLPYNIDKSKIKSLA